MLPLLRALPALVVLASSVPTSAQEAAAQPNRTAVAAEAVRSAAVALRQACASLPPHTNSALPQAELTKVPLPAPLSRPYAAEEDTCVMATNPDQAFMSAAWPIGFMGGVIALIALAFFTFIGGVIRVVWHGPLERFERLFPRRRLQG